MRARRALGGGSDRHLYLRGDWPLRRRSNRRRIPRGVHVVVAAEVIAGRNGRNAKVVALVAALALANIAFHIDDARIGLAEYSTRGALAFIVMLMLLIGGRVTPSFTNNWLAKAGVGERPVPFGRADGAVLAGGPCDRCPPARRGLLQSLAAIALAGTRRTTGCARPGAARRLSLRGAGISCGRGRCSLAWTDALCGWRACLGNRGRRRDNARDDDPRDARPKRPRVDRVAGNSLAYACLGVALIARVAMALAPGFNLLLMHIAAIAWIAGFVAFLIVYGPMLVRRSRRSKP